MNNKRKPVKRNGQNELKSLMLKNERNKKIERKIWKIGQCPKKAKVDQRERNPDFKYASASLNKKYKIKKIFEWNSSFVVKQKILVAVVGYFWNGWHLDSNRWETAKKVLVNSKLTRNQILARILGLIFWPKLSLSAYFEIEHIKIWWALSKW